MVPRTFLSELGERLDLLELAHAFLLGKAVERVLEEVLVGREARVWRNAVVVLGRVQSANHYQRASRLVQHRQDGLGQVRSY